MKIFTTLILSLFCFHYFDRTESARPINLNHTSLEQNNESTQIAPSVNSTSTASEQDTLETISIQDLLLSGIDGNEKIKKKIIDEINDFPTNFKDYRNPMVLTTANYVFPKKLIKYDIDQGYIVFRNVSVSHWYDNNDDNNKFSFSVTCNPPSAAKIRVGLPTYIKILANFSITHSLVETTQQQGAIAIVIRNGAILKEVKATNPPSTYLENVLFQILYTNSNVDVQFEGPQTLIYDKVKTFLDDVTSSLRDFFAQQLNEQMEEHGLSLLSDCSKIRYTELLVKKVNLPYFNNFLNNLYVIPEMKVDTWHGITISAGPIVIDGFSFNSTEFSVFRKFDRCCGISKQVTSRVKTGSLKGKFDWNYSANYESENNSTSVFFFFIDNILFENAFSYDPSYGRWNQNMNVYLGKTKLKPSKSNCDNIEVKFAEFVLSEYLKSAIAESLRKSLSQKTDNSQRSFVQTFFN